MDADSLLYNNFTLEDVESKFSLTLRFEAFLPTIEPIAPSDWLQQTLSLTLPLARTSGSEKSRSEFIIAPILAELSRAASTPISIFSGQEFTVDKEQGLNGICDFLISQGVTQVKINAPIVALVEAKKGVLEDGWGQPATQGSEEASEQSVAVCIAEMVAARNFNEMRGKTITHIHGIVTSGSLWNFLQLTGDNITIDPTEYPLHPLDRLLAILHWLIQHSLMSAAK